MNSSQRKAPGYVVISPVRDEAQHLETTIGSMVQQTVRPAQWILVNDGSTDGTAEIIRRYCSQHSWITGVHLQERRSLQVSGRGNRACLAKEIEAFYSGYERIAVPDWAYLAKIDGDVGFQPDYFERCFAKFEAEPGLGIGGGDICNLVEGKLAPEPTPNFHVRGATKIYRRACWESIGGVVRAAAWDTLDEVKANMKGWASRTFVDLRVVHYRPTGAANGAWKNAVKNGMWSYVAGYHPLYMTARCIRQLFRTPYFLGSIGLMWGYVQGHLQRIPRSADRALIVYLRDQQLRRLSLRPGIWE